MLRIFTVISCLVQAGVELSFVCSQEVKEQVKAELNIKSENISLFSKKPDILAGKSKLANKKTSKVR